MFNTLVSLIDPTPLRRRDGRLGGAIIGYLLASESGLNGAIDPSMNRVVGEPTGVNVIVGI